MKTDGGEEAGYDGRPKPDFRAIIDDPKKTSATAFLASIGHVCLQWSLLELTLIAVLCAIEGIPDEKGDLIFGGLDMQPRINTAINLARYHKLPRPLINELVAIRKALQGGVSERRNQAVHGAHAETAVLGTYRLRMSRWSGDKKMQDVSLEDLFRLIEEIYTLQRRAYGVFEGVGKWKFGRGAEEDAV